LQSKTVDDDTWGTCMKILNDKELIAIHYRAKEDLKPKHEYDFPLSNDFQNP